MEDSEIKSVFKYFSIDQNLYNSIITNELYFSNPRTFNDPFDSNPRFKLCFEKEKLKSFFMYLQIQINKQSDIQSISKYKEKQGNFITELEVCIALKRFDDLYDFDRTIFDDRLIEIHTFYNDQRYFDELFNINVLELQKKMFDDYIFLSIDANQYGIWSASQSETCPLMWGHYANNHKGICIEYQISDKKNEPNLNYPKEKPFDIIKVNYTDEPIDIFSFDQINLEKLTDRILNTKYEKWQYEKEVRLIHSAQGLNKFNKKSLVKIIFGYRTTPRERYAMCKLLAHLKYELELCIARVQPDSYELRIEKMIMHDIAGSGVYLNEMNLDYPPK